MYIPAKPGCIFDAMYAHIGLEFLSNYAIVARMENVLFQKVYAAYSLTPASEVMLEKFSTTVIEALSGYPCYEGLKIITPYRFHLTADFKGETNDIAGYISEIEKRKRNVFDVVTSNGIGYRKSNTNDDGIIFMMPDSKLPFDMKPDAVPHITTVRISKPDGFFPVRLDTMRILEKLQFQWKILRIDEFDNKNLEIDTKKLQIRGTVDNKKKILAEV